MIRAATLTRYTNSRYTAIVLASVAMVAAWCFYRYMGVADAVDDGSIALPDPADWFGPGVGFWINLAAYPAIAAVMILINTTFKLVHGVTAYFAGLFMVMMLATPELLCVFNTGTVLCMVVLLCMWLLYGTYGNPGMTRRVFLVMFMLSTASATQYAFVGYMAVMLAACAQMRIFGLRTVVAAVLGIVTPWWLMLGSGLVSPADVHVPRFTDVFSAIDLQQTLHLALTAAFTALVMLAAIVLNVFKAIAYNAHDRALAGTLTVVSLYTVVAMVVDYSNLPAYLPLLNACCSLHIAHFFITHHREHSWAGMLAVISIYLLFFLWRIVI